MDSINCRGRLISLETPLVMGIINATPDSFYQGHLDAGVNGMLERATAMIEAGADILDIGGLSTRPGSKPIPAAEEQARVLPLITAIIAKHPQAVLSIDTYQSPVAEAAIEAGAHIVNDVSGGTLDDRMLATVARLQVPYICMHMPGTPETMQQDPVYKDVSQDVLDFFIGRVAACEQAGIRDVIIDPGFGFGKTSTHNFQLLKRLSVFSMLKRPILVGLSRKSTIYRTLGVTAADALNGSTVLHTIALLNGASILRVHDVKEARECVSLCQAYKKAP